MKTPREPPAARVLRATFWRQCSPAYALLEVADPAVTTGRYHRAGGRGVWYASSSERGAWAELFRHHEPSGISPLNIIRRMGRVRVHGLKVLDLADPKVRECLGISEADLIGDNLARCQEIAEYARKFSFDGILAPSAALDGERTLAVFSSAMRKIKAARSRVGPPPNHMRALLPRVRF